MTRLTRRSLFATCAGSLAGLRAAGRRPNVVLILADDLGWGDITINGAPDVRTPHIDSIARQGVRFTQSYASAPECTPTRCALLTGRYPQRVGGLECAIGVNSIGRYDEAAWLQKRDELGLPASEPTMGQMFKAAGYDTACFGKWHLGYLEKFSPNRHGFDHYFGILGGNADYFTHEEQGEEDGESHLYENGKQVNRQGYLTDLIADAAISWLKTRADRPFLLYLPFNAPHSPIQDPAEYDPKTGTAPHRDRYRPAYAKVIERMDQRIGDVLQQLEHMRVAEDTIVLFSSDNGGDPNGRNEPYRGRKSLLYEGGIRSPLHVRWPRMLRPGSSVAEVALTMDLLPTLLAATGVHAPAGRQFDGIDLLPYMTGKREPGPRSVFWRFKRGEVVRKAVRSDRWKYVIEDGARSLFDLETDPREQKDVAQANVERVREMKRRLALWEKEVAAPRLEPFLAGKG